MGGLIPQTFIDDLVQRLDIVAIVDQRVSLTKSGRNYQACCPFHDEKTPSFSVEPKRQFYYCFGCGAGGNAIGFVMRYEGLDFPAAVELLAHEAGLEVPRQQSPTARRRQAENTRLLDCLQTASKYYQHQLQHHPAREAAVNYLKSRGLSGEVARHFGLGFAPPGWDNLMRTVGDDKDKIRCLLGAGLIIRQDHQQATDNSHATPENFYDRFRQRIMFPIHDSRGRTTGFGGRVVGDGKPKYINSPETPVFHKGTELYGLYEARHRRENSKHLLLVEGYMDVIALAQMGVHNAVATMGTATTEQHLTRLFATASEIVFCFDGDTAGHKAAWQALETTLPQMQDGRRARFLFLPDGSDPDSYVREAGKEQFLQLVEQAQPLEQFLFTGLSRDLDVSSIEGKARLSKLAKPLLQRLPKGVYAQLMLEKLGEILGIGSASLQQLLASTESARPTRSEAAVASSPLPPSTSLSPPVPGPYRSNALCYQRPAALKAIELLLLAPKIALSIQRDHLQPLRISENDSHQLLLELIEKVQQQPDLNNYILVGACYATALGSQFTQLLAGENITPQEGIADEFMQLVDNILSKIEKQQYILRLKQQVNNQGAAANDDKRSDMAPA